MALKEYKVRNKVTKKYHTGDFVRQWSKTGKSWHTKTSVLEFLGWVASFKGDHFKIDTKTWQVVEFELKEVKAARADFFTVSQALRSKPAQKRLEASAKASKKRSKTIIEGAITDTQFLTRRITM